MDNLTHTLVGLAAGALIGRALPAETDAAAGRTRWRMLLATGALASNLPDIDLALLPFLSRPLGYLLAHRGHTHTVLFALGQALVLVALLWLLWPGVRKLLHESAAARRGVALAAMTGLTLHLGMDFLNSYGVHPFAPLDRRWFYGDTLYIVEPMFWVLLGVPLALQLRRPAWRAVPLALLAAVLLACTWAGFLLPASLALLALAGLLVAVLPRRHALTLGACLSIAFTGVQATASHRAGALVAAALAERDAYSTLLDTALTAYPSNPLCWSFISIENDPVHARYRTTHGVLSLAPALVAPATCPQRIAGAAPAGAGPIAWTGNEGGNIAALRTLARSNCHVEAWLRFARMPALGPASATDLRFGSQASRNFSTIDYAALAGQPCPAWPDWAHPRADLLDSS